MDTELYLKTMKEHLKTAYLLNEEKVETMIPVFLATLRSHMNHLAELANTGDTAELGKASHAVKGALLNIGLLDLAETAYAIEKQCKSGSIPENCKELITDLQYTVSCLSDAW